MDNKRFKHKLNMLEPGIFLCKIIGLGLMAALFCYLFRWDKAALIASGLSSAVFMILIILILIEQHQDNVLYKDAKKEDSLWTKR